MFKSRDEYIILASFTLAVALIFFAVNYTRDGRNIVRRVFNKQYWCVRHFQYIEMHDGYLQDVLPYGKPVEVLDHYFSCNNVERNQTVAIKMTEVTGTQARIVRGIPGDKFTVTKDEKNAGWNIKVNNEIVQFNNGPFYFGNSASEPLLKQNETEFKGVIPKNKYIIMTIVPRGVADSTTFGLISKENIVGLAQPDSEKIVSK
jgi:hypothetical protein